MDRRSRRALSQALVFSFALAFLAAIAVFAGLLPGRERAAEDALFEPPELAFELAAFGELEGWTSDDQHAALEAFLRSCTRIETLDPEAPANAKEAPGGALVGALVAGRVADWLPVCAEARAVAAATVANPADRAAAARSFFEAEFAPLRVLAKRRPKGDAGAGAWSARYSRLGKATGYFEPIYEASATPTRLRPAPALARPADLVMVDLGEFRDAFAGERIAGYVEDGRLRPYPGRAAIERGALGARAAPLAYLDPDDLFFLQIQGSGRVRIEGVGEMRLGYDGQNGRPYTPIGRILIERGALERNAVSMQTIRDWLRRAPADEAQALRETNDSYVFFRRLDDLPEPELGPLGAEGVQLTPMRSIAVDRRFHALGAPFWISVSPADGASKGIDRLVISQDEGGAIRGPVRADLFVGAGEDAGALAGGLNADLEMVALLPRAVAARLPAAALRR